MKKKELLKKQEFAEELGMKFEEVSELFSEETLGTMRMMNVVGGTGEGANNCPNTVAQCACTTNTVAQCACSTNPKKCKEDYNGSDCKGCADLNTLASYPTKAPTTGEIEEGPPVLWKQPLLLLKIKNFS